MPMQEILAEVYRGNTVESVHFGSIVVVDNKGQVQYYAGDPDLISYTRSSLKPFQAVPLTERGGLEKYGFDLKALAIMCGSHSGSSIHTEQVQKNLDKIGLDESYLQCGTHPPIDYRTFNILPTKDEVFTPIQHNCSGKHSGQLALALMLGCDPERYLDPDFEPQKIVKQAVSEICEISPDDMKLGTDGCSLPNYAFPIKNLALGFANIASLKTEGEVRKKAFQTIIEAVQTHPIMVSGEDRSDYYIMQALPKEVFCKLGGEAIQGVGILDKGWGMAVKIGDGNFRALGPVVVEALRQIGVLPDSRLDFVKRIIKPNVYNNRDLLVGHIVPAFKLKKG
jgi:L-asparaginase II